MKIEEFAEELYFPSAVYRASCPVYLDLLRPIATEYINKIVVDNPPDEIYPVIMSEPLEFDERLFEFRDSVLQVAWNILDYQGFYMDPFFTTTSAMWVQSHLKTSSMEYHVHGDGNQLNAFYFLDVPENSSEFLIYDPRSAKNSCPLPRKQNNDITLAQGIVRYTPKEGHLYITNSWLPHSLSRNKNSQPLNFIHININVISNPDFRPQICEAPVII